MEANLQYNNTFKIYLIWDLFQNERRLFSKSKTANPRHFSSPSKYIEFVIHSKTSADCK